MKSFAEQLKAAGHRVEYLTLDDTEKYKDLIDLIVSLCLENDIQQFEYQQPDEYRLSQQLQSLLSLLELFARADGRDVADHVRQQIGAQHLAQPIQGRLSLLNPLASAAATL